MAHTPAPPTPAPTPHTHTHKRLPATSQGYASNYEDDVKLVQQAAKQGLSTKQWLAARLRLGEKKILSGTMDAVRRKLAPIRGIPTKGGGMQVGRGCGNRGAGIGGQLPLPSGGRARGWLARAAALARLPACRSQGLPAAAAGPQLRPQGDIRRD
jgi:hypothetical protein